MFVYVTIERDDQPSWFVSFGNREQALAWIEEMNDLTLDVWSDSYHNFSHLVGDHAQPTPEEARRRIVEEINEIAETDSDVERVEL